MKRFMGYVLMSEEELNQIHLDWDKLYLSLAEDFVKVDLELMKMKGEDPNRPRMTFHNIHVHSSAPKVNENG